MSEEKEIVLSVENLTKTFYKDLSDQKGTGFHALDQVSFSLQKGEVLGVIGSNGAGKSTLLKVLSEITGPTSGRIEYEGRITSIIDIGTGFHPDLSGRENVYLNGTITGLSRKEITARYDEIVEFSGLEDYMEMPVKNYSSGMYLRLAFSVALISDIDILLLDEILAVGDRSFRDKCKKKIRELIRSGTSAILVSHDMNLIIEFCERCMFLENGKLMKLGSSLEVIQDYIERTANTSGAKVRMEREPYERYEGCYKQLQEIAGLKYDEFQIDAFDFSIVRDRPDDGKLFRSDKIRVTLEYTKYHDTGSLEITWMLKGMEDIIIFIDSLGIREGYDSSDMEAGHYELIYTIPEKFLNISVYTLALVITGGVGEVVQESIDVVRFRVENENEDFSSQIVRSLIRPEFKWEMNVTKKTEH